jgi:hypothetical protein
VVGLLPYKKSLFVWSRANRLVELQADTGVCKKSYGFGHYCLEEEGEGQEGGSDESSDSGGGGGGGAGGGAGGGGVSDARRKVWAANEKKIGKPIINCVVLAQLGVPEQQQYDR